MQVSFFCISKFHRQLHRRKKITFNNPFSLHCPSEIEATKQGYPTISGRLYIYGTRFCNTLRECRQGRTQTSKESIPSRHATGMPHRWYRKICNGLHRRKDKRQALSRHDGLLAWFLRRHATGNCGQPAGCRVLWMGTLHPHTAHRLPDEMLLPLDRRRNDPNK